MVTTDKLRFKDVTWAFDKRQMAKKDILALKDLFYATINGQEWKSLGGFSNDYPEASNFRIFNDYEDMLEYSGQFSLDWEYNTSYLLEGVKYYLFWTFE